MSMHRQVGYSSSGQQYVLSIDGSPPIPLETLSMTDNGHPGSGLLMPPRETLVEAITQNGVGLGLLFHDELDHLRAQVTRLESWLSGVQPVEDPDVPGRFFCGCCGHVLPTHVSGCPVAGN